MEKKKRVSKYSWQEVLIKYFGSECTWCGTKKKLAIHHSIPLVLGGANEMSNLECVCRPCHWELHRQIKKVFPDKKLMTSKCENCGRDFEHKRARGTLLCIRCRKFLYSRQTQALIKLKRLSE